MMAKRKKKTARKKAPTRKKAPARKAAKKASGKTAPKIGKNRGNAGKGRPKGSPNKVTQDVREASRATTPKRKPTKRKPTKPADDGRNAQGRFTRGNRGNPNGRKPKGLPTVEQLRKALAGDLDGIIESVVAKAKDGDMAACRLLLDRIIPPLKATEVAVILPGGMDGTLTDQGRAILQNMAGGALSPSQAAQLLGALSAQARITEVDELERRIAALETMREQK